MVNKSYSLRPPAVAKDGLETLFRVEMKKDDLAAEGLKPGDAVIVTAQSTGKGGVGVVSLSTDAAKSQGNSSFVKMHPKLREFMGLDLSEKCSISKFEDVQPRVKSIRVSISGKGRVEETQEDITHLASVALGRRMFKYTSDMILSCL